MKTWQCLLGCSPSPQRNASLLTPSAHITVSLDWVSFPMPSTQLNPWQTQLWEEATLIFVSIRDLTDNQSGNSHPGVKGVPSSQPGLTGQTPGCHQEEQHCCFIPKAVFDTSALSGTSASASGLPGLGWWGGGDNIQNGLWPPPQEPLPDLRGPYHGTPAAS